MWLYLAYDTYCPASGTCQALIVISHMPRASLNQVFYESNLAAAGTWRSAFQAIPASHRRPLQSRFDVVPCGFGRNSEACGFHLDSSIFVIHVHTFFRFAGETTPNCDSKVVEPAAAAAHLFLIILVPVQNGLNMTNTHMHTHVTNILSHDRLESHAYVANRRSISVCTNCRCLQQWSSCFFGCRKHAANSLVLNLHLELLNVGGNVGGMKIDALFCTAVLWQCKSFGLHFCASGAGSPALGPHTFSRLEPGIGVGGAGLQSLGRLVLFFFCWRTALPWDTLGDLRWSWVARGDGSIYGETGRWRWKKGGPWKWQWRDVGSGMFFFGP